MKEKNTTPPEVLEANDTAAAVDSKGLEASESTAEGKTDTKPVLKVWNVIFTAFTYLMMAAAVAMMIFTIVSVNTFDRNDRDLFGYKAFIVRSDSMSATDFSAGDLAFIKEVDPSTLNEGDIIAFRSEDPKSMGDTFTHKIRSKTTTEDGSPAFVTYGTTTNVNDEYPAAYDQVLGKYQFAIPKVGMFFTFLKTIPGYICCILIPFLILILIQGLNSIKLFRKYKAEQMAELDEKHRIEMAEMAAEREKIAAERAESQKMLEELKRMQAKLAQQGSTDNK